MGTILKRQIHPNATAISNYHLSSLLNNHTQVSRSNFIFLRQVHNAALPNESILWLACNKENMSETYFIRQTSKLRVYNNKKTQSVLNELLLFAGSSNENMLKVYFAFQDFQYLYLVSQALESQSLEDIITYHTFTESQTKYIITSLLSIIDYAHSQQYAITELSPKNIHINSRGELKMINFTNPSIIDACYSSNAKAEICPYSAPEILYRDKILAQADFYSLGLIAYELMTQKKINSIQNGPVSLKRNHMLKENIQVQKSQIPEDWKPDVADFLIKLLIKNPSYRLGRYGTYEVKSHSWLKEFDYEGIKKIWLQEQKNRNISQAVKLTPTQLKLQEQNPWIKQYFFQQLFQKYEYRCESENKKGSHENEYLEGSEGEKSSNKINQLFNESSINLRKKSL